ncbi:hypothetical protein [Polynucleobacter sp. Tro8-14-1]|jgi:hypothetical protein|uniref:hypothetical protein n=1 Tax=Polynucleobacter sp. Tro8-14-1 TaxID=1758383 RepID=UPI001BFEC9E8|nr:hypothetical protein [Polynucleobacter sp. Tro8-14-1]MBT8567211.1 hypothetical protein [Polynucleobacter paneuropaeus]MBU3562352.1 hypothetical protein [Polynucleobacter sp. Tro8-14-1]
MSTVWELQVIKYYQQYCESEKILLEKNNLFKAMTYFKIIRNFNGIGSKENKEEFLQIINSVVNNSKLSSEQKYIELFNKLKQRYNKQFISATSKILWLRDNKEQHIIFDDNAIKNVIKLRGKIKASGYEKYFMFCKKWRELFKENEKQILKSTQRVKEFYLDTPNFSSSDIDVMDKLWFRMRVFDIYLWGL